MTSVINRTCLPPRCTALAIALSAALSAPAFAQDAPDGGSARSLDEIVVTASGFEQAIREAPASISVITRDELQTKPVHSLADALVDVEGVDVGVGLDKTGAPQISLRGMPASYTLILVDGRRQNSSGNVTPNDFGSTANNFIPPMSAIERIEVIRGPMSTLYGSDAMGGVVNIITRRIGQDWSGNLTLETTLQGDDAFGDTVGGNVYLHGPVVSDVLGIALRGGRYRRDSATIRYDNLNGGEVTPIMGANPTEYDNRNAGLRLNLALGQHHDLWLDVSANRQEYDNSDGQLGTLGTGGYAGALRFNRDQALLAWDARFGFGGLEASYLRSRTETIGRTVPPGVPGAGQARALENENRVFDTKLVSELGAHKLTVGGQHWQAELRDGVAPAPFEFTQWALFAEDEWRLTDALNLTLGARHDDHDTFGSHLSPRAYLVWNASENWVVKGGYSEGYKTPNVEQLTPGINGFGGQGTIPLIGTPGLKPETSATSEIGVYYAGATGISASVTLFNNDFDDKIAAGTPVNNCAFGVTQANYTAGNYSTAGCLDLGFFPRAATFGQSVNIDKAVTRGGELAVRVPLASDWALGANYTYTESEQKSGPARGQPLTNTPRHMLNANLQWQASAALNVFVRGEYRSERYRGTGAAQDQLGDFKPYSQFHLGARYVINDSVSVNAALYNVFDKDFVDYLPYISNPTAPPASQTWAYANTRSTSESGRRLWLSVNVAF